MNETHTHTPIPMSSSSSSSNSPKTPKSETPTETTEHPKTLETSSDPPLMDGGKETLEDQGGQGQEEDEKEGECGFCLFMKGGGCRDSFIAWEKCVAEGDKKNEDIVEKCFEVTSALKKCMETHPDYYGPILQAEKAAEQQAIEELEKDEERETESTENQVVSDGLEQTASS